MMAFIRNFTKAFVARGCLNVFAFFARAAPYFLYHLPVWLIDLGAWLNSLQAVEYKAWIALKMKNGFPIRGRIHPAHYGLLYYVKAGGKPTFNRIR